MDYNKGIFIYSKSIYSLPSTYIEKVVRYFLDFVNASDVNISYNTFSADVSFYYSQEWHSFNLMYPTTNNSIKHILISPQNREAVYILLDRRSDLTKYMYEKIKGDNHPISVVYFSDIGNDYVNNYLKLANLIDSLNISDIHY